MDALTIDLMGNRPLSEAEIQARAQDIIEAGWPAWRRERALRYAATGDASKVDALNAFLAEVSATVDQCRADSALLTATMAFEAAQERLLQPVYDGPTTVETLDGIELHPDLVRDDDERTAAQATLDTASDDVIALAIARIPPEPEPEPEPEVLP